MADILLRGLILPSKKSSRAAQHAADALSRRGQDRPRVVLCEGARLGLASRGRAQCRRGRGA